MAQGFFVEFLLTGILVFAFLASSSNDNNRKDFGFANALAVGLAITLAHLVGVCLHYYKIFSKVSVHLILFTPGNILLLNICL